MLLLTILWVVPWSLCNDLRDMALAGRGLLRTGGRVRV